MVHTQEKTIEYLCFYRIFVVGWRRGCEAGKLDKNINVEKSKVMRDCLIQIKFYRSLNLQ